MLPGQMSLWQLESVQDSPRNLYLKFGQNRASNSWNIMDIEFLWGGGGGGVCTVIFMSNLQLQLGWGYVVVELGFWQWRWTKQLRKAQEWRRYKIMEQHPLTL